ncbi:MAG TPA: hypothetical protein VFA20_03690 [Myxococcaceae bacterium]|nr:hypothetical protein [Myxococcaceae bacterium]
MPRPVLKLVDPGSELELDQESPSLELRGTSTTRRSPPRTGRDIGVWRLSTMADSSDISVQDIECAAP